MFLIPCLWLCFARIYVLVCFCHVLCLDPHPYMLICLDSCSSMFMCQLSHVFTRIAMPMPRSTFLHACVLGFRFSHAYMSKSMFLHARVFRSLLYLLYAIFHVLVCFVPCLCAQTQAMFVLPCAIVALLSLYLSFLCFGHVVGTRSRPCGLCHHPYTLAHIKGFGSLFACLCLLASMLYLSCQPLQFQAFLCLMPLMGCGCVVTSDTYEALSGCNHLGGISVMPVALCIPLPFLLHVMICLQCLFVPPVGFLCIFTCLLTCSCMSFAFQCVIHVSTQ